MRRSRPGSALFPSLRGRRHVILSKTRWQLTPARWPAPLPSQAWGRRRTVPTRRRRHAAARGGGGGGEAGTGMAACVVNQSRSPRAAGSASQKGLRRTFRPVTNGWWTEVWKGTRNGECLSRRQRRFPTREVPGRVRHINTSPWWLKWGTDRYDIPGISPDSQRC